MEPSTNNSNKTIKTVFIVVALVIVAGLIGWKIGQPDKPATNQAANNTSQPDSSTPTTNNAAAGEVKSLVSFTLPDGWSESSCPAAPGTVYVVPAGASADCSANPSSPVKISVDPGNSKDCNQLQNVQNVKKHICSSVFINNHKTLKALTEYNQDSSYKKDTTLAAYYFDAGKAVVKVEYLYNSSNDYEAGFDQLANSLQAKS
ncbi:MAG: hypothetical protein ACR2FM_01550 [Candidatus Saccharimonadales bacterium]